MPAEIVCASLGSRADGLTTAEARERIARFGLNTLRAAPHATALALLARQFGNPVILVLVAAAGVSVAVGEWVDATIIFVIVLGSGLLGFVQEHRASQAVGRLRARLALRTTVLRDGAQQQVPSAEIVPGDVVLLSAGSLVPADGLVLEAHDFHVTQAALTGESDAVEKIVGPVAADAAIAARTNAVFMGTSARSGTARALIVATGDRTHYGEISDRLRLRPPETEFARGLRRYGYLLTRVMLVMVLIVFAANVFLAKPPVDSLLFAIALAVGLSPELLPAIVSVTLATGARRMAARGVIVRRLEAIENLGSMDVLCTDKTGTLTEGVMALDAALDPAGVPSPGVLRDAVLNATLQAGLENPLDEGIVDRGRRDGVDVSRFVKTDEVPYDFVRRRLSIVAREADGPPLMVTKGALAEVLSICSTLREAEQIAPLDDARRAGIENLFAGWSAEGFRVLGLATRQVQTGRRIGRADEAEMTFAGFLLFLDPPKQDIRETLAGLSERGIRTKMITGDNRLVARHLAGIVGLGDRIVTGEELGRLRDEALWRVAEQADVFAEIDPTQKERIILALRKTGHVVGYLGDGINDAPALHAADVGISVDKAVDVAREAADFVLLEHDLDVLRAGVEEGRRTFANTLKYIAITTSANLGNMISMAVASVFLPFLPLLAKQILLNNFLSDFPGLAIAGDRVDPETMASPRRWDMRRVLSVMIVFGLVSSAFDILTFAVLLGPFAADPELFRTGWFVESLMTELVIVFVIRTWRPAWASRPGRLLVASTVVVVALTLAIPWLPGAALMGFVPLPPTLLGVLVGITVLYVAASEIAKRRFARLLR